MKTIPAYSYDEEGWFTEETYAIETPRGSGRFCPPAYATLKAPMPYCDEKYPKFIEEEGVWRLEAREFIPPEKASALLQMSQYISQLLQDTDYLVIRHRDQQELGVKTTLSEENYKCLQIWRQELRCLNKHKNWPNVTIPSLSFNGDNS